MPRSLEPSLATLVTTVPQGDDWIHEIKWDGYRLLAFKSRKGVRLLTRRGHDWTIRFPSIAAAVGELDAETAILDGEAVIEDESGAANFSALQAALGEEGGKAAHEARFYAFDLLYIDGFDLRSLPLKDRKARLAALVSAEAQGFLRLGEHIEADGEAMLRSACQLGLEGVISKRRDRPYTSGRNTDWVKTKCTERQEFVVIGYVPSTASARAVGSLVMGYHEDGRLKLAGRVGTGYTGEVARALWKKLSAIKRASPALDARPTAEEKRGVLWTEPALVAEVEFRGWTGEDRLRHAAFKGLREDKSPAEIVRERASAPPSEAGEAPPLASKPARPSPARRSGAEVAGVQLTHPDRVLWPSAGLTKQGLAEFYEEIAEWLLPQVVDRPLSLVRCPSGAESGCFFQKHSWAGLSEHILRRIVHDGDEEEEVLFVRDLRGIIALVQASVLEIHPWGSRIDDVDRPDRIVMDLDPGEGVALEDVIAAAREVRNRLAAQKLESFVKTTGGKGLHVVVPLTGPDDWVTTKAFAKALADGMEADNPGRYIAKATKSARRGLIYVDYLRNGRGATAVAAYSTRARAGAPVAVPVAWSELGPGLSPARFTVANLPARLARLRNDPWADLAKVKQRLPTASARPKARARAGRRRPAESE